MKKFRCLTLRPQYMGKVRFKRRQWITLDEGEAHRLAGIGAVKILHEVGQNPLKATPRTAKVEPVTSAMPTAPKRKRRAPRKKK